MDIAEKRVFEDTAGRTRLAVGTGAGLAIVGIAGDVIGEFGLAVREPVRDLVPAGDDRLLVATDEALLTVDLGGDDGGIAAHDGVERHALPGDAAPTTVAIHDERAIVADEDGAVDAAPLDATTEADEPIDWRRLGQADVRAADGRLLAAADGVYRIDGDDLAHVGLEDVRDVAAAGPLAATAEGCYRLGPGWTRDLEGAFDVVAASWQRDDDRAHAAAGASLHERAVEADSHDADSPDARNSPDAWTVTDWPPDAPVADVAYAEATYAVATDGTVLADAGDGWRTRSIGLPDVSGCAVVR